ncbi:uncharacterized protein [Nicotiana sylvestris]|uniref:uncharacterized protein n=1 Tax=Nicotiana sylvestris TaxID=4096 RepID=UPI00388CB9F9
MGRIEMMFEQMMKKNVDSYAQLASHNTLIRNLEVQFGQILQSLNTRLKGALPSDTVLNPKSGNNTGHAMVVITRNGRGGDVNTSKQKEVVSDEVEVETQDDVNPSREHVIDKPETIVPKDKAPLPRIPPPYPQRLAKQNNENQFKKFIEMMKSMSINVPLVKALEQMSGYAKFMRDLVTKKRSMDCETIKMTHQVSAILHSMAPKVEDPGAFTIPCTIGSVDFAKALRNLGSNINLMPYSVFRTLGIGQPRATSMRLQMVDRTIKRLLGIIDDVLVRWTNYEVLIILGRPFLAIGKALVDMEAGELTFRVIVDNTSAMENVEDPLEIVFLNLDVNEDEGRVECVNALHGSSNSYEPRKLSLDFENKKTPPTKPLIEKPPVLELKPLPLHLRCNTGGALKKKESNWMVSLADIRGISPAFCMHKIILEDDAKPSVEHQRRLNEAMMPFGLCNASATFQRCMMAIFTDMVEDFLEVFMDDFNVVGDSFDECFKNLDKVLA